MNGLAISARITGRKLEPLSEEARAGTLNESSPELVDGVDRRVRSPEEQGLTVSCKEEGIEQSLRSSNTAETSTRGIEQSLRSSNTSASTPGIEHSLRSNNTAETTEGETESMCSMSKLSIGSLRITIASMAQEALRRQLLLPKLFARRGVDPPDARCLLKQEPPLELRVTSPRGPASCVGIYELAADRKANKFPCWRHVDGTHWLFSSTQGRWIIGGPDLQFDEFWRTNGILSQGALHGGRLPHIQGVTWQRWTGARIIQDSAISVIVHKAAAPPTNGVSLTVHTGKQVSRDVDDPAEVRSQDGKSEVRSQDGKSEASTVETEIKPGEVLRLVSPHSHEACEGDYRLVPDTVVNGHPLYELKDGGRWLYTGLDGRWYFGGYFSKEKDFACSSGYIFHDAPHNGQLPHELEGHWWWGDSCDWYEDSAIQVVDVACLAKLGDEPAEQEPRVEYPQASEAPKFFMTF